MIGQLQNRNIFAERGYAIVQKGEILGIFSTKFVLDGAVRFFGC